MRADHTCAGAVAQQDRDVPAVVGTVDPRGEDFVAGDKHVTAGAGPHEVVGQREPVESTLRTCRSMSSTGIPLSPELGLQEAMQPGSA